MPIYGKKPSQVDVNWRGGIHKAGVKLWHVGVHSAKDLLYARLSRPGQVHLSKHLPAEVFKQLTAEHRVRHRTAHGMRSVWVKRSAGARNEAWDLGVYAIWCGERLGLSKWPKKIWEQLRERVAPDVGDLFAPPATAFIVPHASAPAEMDTSKGAIAPASAGNVGTEAGPGEPFVDALAERTATVAARPVVSRETKPRFVPYQAADADRGD